MNRFYSATLFVCVSLGSSWPLAAQDGQDPVEALLRCERQVRALDGAAQADQATMLSLLEQRDAAKAALATCEASSGDAPQPGGGALSEDERAALRQQVRAELQAEMGADLEDELESRVAAQVQTRLSVLREEHAAALEALEARLSAEHAAQLDAQVAARVAEALAGAQSDWAAQAGEMQARFDQLLGEIEAELDAAEKDLR